MPKLHREQIVETALRLMDEHGIEWLTMRRLAEALGVSAPTLYWHLPDKDALHDACVDRALAEIELPIGGGDDWRTGMRAFMFSMRAELGRHPSATHLMTRSHPAGVARIASGAISLMRTAGLEWDDAFLHCRLMIWRVVGFAGMEHTLRTASELHRPAAKTARARSATRFRLTVEWPDELPGEARDASTLVDLDLMFSTDVEMFVAGVGRAVQTTDVRLP
jgi:AcrR family transcriptional regulator